MVGFLNNSGELSVSEDVGNVELELGIVTGELQYDVLIELETTAGSAIGMVSKVPTNTKVLHNQ